MTKGPTKGSLQLGDVVRRIRMRRSGSASLAEFGRSIGISGQFVGQVERGEKSMSLHLAREIAGKYGRSKEDEQALLGELLQAIAEANSPGAGELVRGGVMPLVGGSHPRFFLELVQRDVERSRRTVSQLAEAIGTASSFWRQFLAGGYALSYRQVEKLAAMLGADQVTYLLAAGYVPEELGARVSGGGGLDDRAVAFRLAWDRLIRSLGEEADARWVALADEVSRLPPMEKETVISTVRALVAGLRRGER